MKTNSFASTGLALALAAFSIAACSTSADDPPGKGGTGGSNPLGGTGGAVTAGTGGAGGAAGNVQTGGAGGGLPTGGTGGTPPTAGTGGSPVAGMGGTPPIAGAAGTPPLGGSGGDAGGGLGGAAGSGAGAAGTGNTTDVTVQLGMQRQLMRGFGINNNWAPAMTDAVADRLFGMGAQQLGLNVLRIGMGSNGEPYNGQSCYDDINKFVQRGGEYVIGTLWSPPAECKDNNSIIDGGHLLESCYESWSNTIAAFPGKISQNSNGELYAMSPQNEVDFASCGRSEPCNGNYDTTVMTGAEAAAFQKIVGPKLRAANTIPMSPEASEWIHVWSNESACCSVPSNLPSSDPLDCGFPPTNCPAGAPFDDGYEYGYALWADSAAWAAFDIMGTHQYDSQIAYAWPSDVTEKKEVWQTEMSGVKWWPEQGEVDNNGVLTTCSTHIENGVAVARWIHSGITVGEASAWLYWWYQAIDTDDNEGLICKDGRVAKRLWTMGQFSKFIRPGHHMVTVTGTLPDKVLLAASVGPNNTPVVIVAINETTAAVNIPINFAGGTAPTAMDVVQTSATDDLAQKDPVTLTGSVLDAALPAMSVTTFISM